MRPKRKLLTSGKLSPLPYPNYHLETGRGDKCSLLSSNLHQAAHDVSIPCQKSNNESQPRERNNGTQNHHGPRIPHKKQTKNTLWGLRTYRSPRFQKTQHPGMDATMPPIYSSEYPRQNTRKKNTNSPPKKKRKQKANVVPQFPRNPKTSSEKTAKISKKSQRKK